MSKLILPRRSPLMASPAIVRARSLGSQKTRDTSFTFRMGAGFAGDVNRGHPASIQPSLISPINPITAYGQACVIDTAGGANGGVRPLAAGDIALTEIWGVTCRPYPMQQTSNSNFSGAAGYGSVTPPPQQPVDVLRGGYIMVSVVGAPARGGTVYVWCAASGGGHTQGGFEAAASGGNTCTLDAQYQWNSPADSSNIAELICSKF